MARSRADNTVSNLRILGFLTHTGNRMVLPFVYRSHGGFDVS